MLRDRVACPGDASNNFHELRGRRVVLLVSALRAATYQLQLDLDRAVIGRFQQEHTARDLCQMISRTFCTFPMMRTS